ncbi:MAG TPA: helix-turn-helix transcriptional regulator [Gaiellaceae bacterium]|nr:helix-turn-helix transcriptional regulator [Gaiellaceae bacterium]
MNVDELARGREAYASQAWLDAYDALSRADTESPLEAADVELFATSAALVGERDAHHSLLERLHKLRLDEGEIERAAKAAVLLGMNLAIAGEVGPAMGWFGRAERLVEQVGEDSVVPGYLLLPVIFQRISSGDSEGTYRAASEAAAIAERFGEHDLFATASNFAGAALIRQGRVEEGLQVLDEAMVAVTAGEVSPFFAGIVYCGVIACCEEAFEPRRAQEWTNALTRWCEAQPQLVSFTGRCLAHRAGIKQLHGAWADALEEAVLARERCEQAMNRAATGQAYYQQAELHRLRGDYAAAEAAYRDASRFGREPQPGLALLRLAQGETDAAAGALGRALAETPEPLQRAVLLPAFVEVALAQGSLDDAASASAELDETSGRYGRPMLTAIAAQVRGSVELARGEPQAALRSLRGAWQFWEQLDAPYEGARVRLLVGLSCRALGDEDGAVLELEAARAVFDALGATPEVRRVDDLAGRSDKPASHGLSGRELEVLRLLASGRTNRAIAAELVVSEHTVARHVQNIFTKLGVSSRTAATAFAFEHDLV